MSGFFKNRLKGKKVALPEVKPPRALEEIQKEYSEAIGKAGQTQYLVSVYNKELEGVNRRLLELNQEAAQANAVAKAAETAAQAAQTGETNEQK